jgi:glycosyltransferase involved in cell wall biosynthesis
MRRQPSEFGGGYRVFLQIMERLSKDTFNIFSCCPFNHEQKERLKASGVRIINTNLDNNPFVSILKLSKIMRSENIHIVHTQGGRDDFYARVAGRIAKVPVVVNTVATLVEGYDVSFLKKIVYVLCDRLTERFVDQFIVVSESLRKTIIRNHGIQPDKVIKIYNGIELDQYQPHPGSREKIRKDFLISEEEFLVGAAGRLVYEKGFEFLIRSVQKVLKTFPKTKFLLVGDGPLKMKLESLARELGIMEYCIFSGFRDDIPEILSSLDLFVLPSILEGHPIVILEAMAMAKPIVASDINGVREQIENGRTGVLVPRGDPQALAEAINQMLKERIEAKKLGMEARKQVEETFDIRRQVALHEEVYKGLLKGRRAEG